MKKLLIHILCFTEVVLCAADLYPLSEETLKQLSAAGGRYIDEQIQQSLLGVKQMKEMMGEKEEKHRHLMDALRHSSEKKKGAAHLAQETEKKLKEAEQHCQDLTKSSFGKCRPCLEDSCKGFYTSTCRRGFSSFSSKVQDFFRRMATQLETNEHVYSQKQEDSGLTSADKQLTNDGDNVELLQADASFNQLVMNASLMYNHSVELVRKMQQVFGSSTPVAAFTAELQPSSQGALNDPSFSSVGLDRLLGSVYNLGRKVLEDFSSTVVEVYEEMQEAEEFIQQSSRRSFSAWQYQSGNLCRRLRRQASECWQLQDLCETCRDHLLKECSSVQQLHSESEQMYTLLNASCQQYNDRLQLVQRHTADTGKWLGYMDDKYGWVSQLYGSTAELHNVFTVITVNPQQQRRSTKPEADTSVVVSVLGSAPVTISVPADLEVDEPAFIQFVAQEALTLHKHQIRGLEKCEDPDIPAVLSDAE